MCCVHAVHMHGHACACLSQAKLHGSATVDPLRLSPVSDAVSQPALPHPSSVARSKPRQAAKPVARKLPAAAAAAVEEEGGMLPLPTPLAATVAERWPSELVEWDGPLQRAQRAVAEAVGIMARPVLELGRALLDAAPRATQAPT